MGRSAGRSTSGAPGVVMSTMRITFCRYCIQALRGKQHNIQQLLLLLLLLCLVSVLVVAVTLTMTLTVVLSTLMITRRTLHQRFH
jgi:hypothetical protein